MAFDDSFRERIVLDADETQRRYGIRKRTEIYELVGFGEPMTEWARKASELGATIVPRQVYLSKLFDQHDHRVAWVYHSQKYDDYIEDNHHVACDCVAHLDNPSGDIEAITECPAVLSALEHRAARVSQVMLNRGIFDFFGMHEGRINPNSNTVTPIKDMVKFLMKYDKTHPEGWIANTIGKEHQVGLLAAIMQVQPYPDEERPEARSMMDIIEEMHEEELIVLHPDGQTVSLPEST